MLCYDHLMKKPSDTQNVAIPHALHKRVKTAAARKGVSMRIFIAAALTECLKVTK